MKRPVGLSAILLRRGGCIESSGSTKCRRNPDEFKNPSLPRSPNSLPETRWLTNTASVALAHLGITGAMEPERRRRRPAVYVRAFCFVRFWGLGVWGLVGRFGDNKTDRFETPILRAPHSPSLIPFRRSAQLFDRPCSSSELTHQTTQHSSCVLCRRRKIRCNRETPCSNCTKSKNATCVYRDPPRAPRPPPPSERRQGAFGDTSQTADVGLVVAGGAGPLTPSSGIQSTTPTAPSHHHPSRPASTAPANSIAESTLDTRSPGHHVPPGRSRTAPEHAVSSAPSTANTPVSTFTRNSRVETKTLHLSGDFYFHTEHKLACQPQAVTRSVSHKTRMFGQSHWVNSIGLVTKPLCRSTPSPSLIVSVAQ